MHPRAPARSAAALLCALFCAPPCARAQAQRAPTSAPSTATATAQDAGIEPAPPDLGPTVRFMALVGAALSLLPGAVGTDVSVGPRATETPRLLVAWPLQIPVRFPGPSTRTATFTNHRIVVAPEMVLLGPQRGLRAGETALVTFRARAGYRLVFHPRGGVFGFFAGAGSTVEFWPLVRPSVSPELGLHVGACCGEAAFVGTLTLRGDVFFAGDNDVRLSAMAGWAFY